MASPMPSIPLLTAEEYLEAAYEGRTELVQGEVVRMSPAGGLHGNIAWRIARRIGPVIDENRLGEIFIAEAGFILFRDPDTVRAPDLAFVRSERLPKGGLPEGFFPGPPDLAVEVVSPGDRWSEIEEKVEDYLNAGTLEVWVVEPRKRLVQLCRGQERRVLRGEEALSSPLLPGFSLSIAALFA